MTDTNLVAVIGAVAPTLTGIAVLISSLRNGRKSDAIRVQTNSLMTGLIQKLELADQRIEGLEKALAQMVETRTATATAQAVTDSKMAYAAMPSTEPPKP